MIYDLRGTTQAPALIFALGLVAMDWRSGGSSTVSPTPETHTITSVHAVANTICSDLAGSAFSYFPGLTTTVTDGQGAVLDTGKLSTEGVTVANPTACDLSYTIRNVQELRAIPSIAASAGPVTYTYDELKADNWQADLKIGG